MNPLDHLCDLLLQPGSHPQGQAHLSAASALVRTGGYLYVVADDELHLGVFDEKGLQPGRLLQLFAGELPLTKAERKAAKPDLEALALLPAGEGLDHGALLALGSGSTLTRQTGVLLALDAVGAVAGDPRLLDLAALYAPLRERFSDLNIEGAFLLGEQFILLQRGNQGGSANAVVRYAWSDLRACLIDATAAAPTPQAIDVMQLGELDGVALGFTDGAALAGGRWLFSAVAENTTDSYQDGACVGTLIGLVEADGAVQRIAELDGRWKVEGIALDEAGDLLLVTDADDPATAASLLRLSTRRHVVLGQ